MLAGKHVGQLGAAAQRQDSPREVVPVVRSGLTGRTPKQCKESPSVAASVYSPSRSTAGSPSNAKQAQQPFVEERTYYQPYSAPLSAQDVVARFFRALNERDISTLLSLFDDDCLHEDLSHEQAATSKEDIARFYHALVACWAEKQRVVIEDMTDGGGSKVCVTWRMEVDGSEIPFSRGLSFYKVNLATGRIAYVRQSPEHFIKVAELALSANASAAPLIDSLGPLALPSFWSNLAKGASHIFANAPPVDELLRNVAAAGASTTTTSTALGFPMPGSGPPGPAGMGAQGFSAMLGTAHSPPGAGASPFDLPGSLDGALNGMSMSMDTRNSFSALNMGMGNAPNRARPAPPSATSAAASPMAPPSGQPQQPLLHQQYHPQAPGASSFASTPAGEDYHRVRIHPDTDMTFQYGVNGNTAIGSSYPASPPNAVNGAPHPHPANGWSTVPSNGHSHSNGYTNGTLPPQAQQQQQPSASTITDAPIRVLPPTHVNVEAPTHSSYINGTSAQQQTVNGRGVSAQPVNGHYANGNRVVANGRHVHVNGHSKDRPAVNGKDVPHVNGAANGAAASKGTVAPANGATAAKPSPAGRLGPEVKMRDLPAPQAAPAAPAVASPTATQQPPAAPSEASVTAVDMAAAPAAAPAQPDAAPAINPANVTIDVEASSVSGGNASSGSGDEEAVAAAPERAGASSSDDTPPSRGPVDLSGIWVKDLERSELGEYEKCLDMWGLSGVQKATAKLIEGLEVSHKGDKFEVHFLTIIPYFKVTETYRINGPTTKNRRRDLRSGDAVSKTHAIDGGVFIETSFGDSFPGNVEETYWSPEPDVMHVRSTIMVGDRSKGPQKRASTLQIYHRQRDMSKRDFIKSSERRNGSATDIIKPFLGPGLKPPGW